MSENNEKKVSEAVNSIKEAALEGAAKEAPEMLMEIKVPSSPQRIAIASLNALIGLPPVASAAMFLIRDCQQEMGDLKTIAMLRGIAENIEESLLSGKPSGLN